MANRTVKEAKTIKGTNPQFLVDKIVRSRIYESQYWKEDCFALTAELLVDKAMELRYVGGTFAGNIKPTPFLCLTLKMLQIQPDRDIIIEFIKNEEFKYVRALGAFYLRLTGTSLDCYKYLEPLLNDYRKIRLRNRDGEFVLSHMDEYIDDILHEERYADIALPRIQKRDVLEANNQLEPRISLLFADDEFNDLLNEQAEVEAKERESERKRSVSPSNRRRSERRDSDDRDRSHRSRHDENDADDRKRRDDKRSRRHRSRSPHDSNRRDSSRHHRPSRTSASTHDDNREHRAVKTGKDGSLSVEETNKLRASLGLAPLK